jgi:hypothetical protein
VPFLRYWMLGAGCLGLAGCATLLPNLKPPPETRSSAPKEKESEAPSMGDIQKTVNTPSAGIPTTPVDDSFSQFQAFARRRADEQWGLTPTPPPMSDTSASAAVLQSFRDYGRTQGEKAQGEFLTGRFNRSRARLPGNIEKWRAEPDIGNPGPDLANFPNSAFTLPRGRAYIELSPFTFYGSGFASPAQYNAEFLLRYGLTDDIELRLFGNGLSWMGGSRPAWGFSPIAFDTKIQLWTEKPDWFVPAAGFEAYVQTEWLGNKAFNGGTQPSFTFNFDQSLPWEIDFEYNVGTTRFQDAAGKNIWEFSFQWAFQRDLFDKDFAVFVHGFYNAASLPRIPNINLPYDAYHSPSQNAVGAGFIWTANKRLAAYGQVSGGTTKFTPSIISLLGFALSF